MTEALPTTDPNADLFGEFKPRPPRTGGYRPGPPRTNPDHVVILPPDPAAFAHNQKLTKAWTQNQMRTAMTQLVAGNVDTVQSWLYEVAKDSPSRAVELFIELLKFSLPQLKETALTVTRNGDARTYRSSQELLDELNKET